MKTNTNPNTVQPFSSDAINDAETIFNQMMNEEMMADSRFSSCEGSMASRAIFMSPSEENE